MARDELARFLRDRRAALRPEAFDMAADTTPRRTPGLRREEVAELAHMSVDYFTRLEQARGPRPSPRILDALASALRLAPAERRHLFHLAGTPVPPGPGPVRHARPHVTGMLRRLPGTAAVVTDAAYDIVAWNPLARALLGDAAPAPGEERPRSPRERSGSPGERPGGPLDRPPNLARRRFLGEGAWYETSGSEEFGHLAVARLRRAAQRYPHDARLSALLAELRAGSEEFRQIWETRPVHAPGHRTKTLDHPTAGRLRLNCDVLLVPADDQETVLITADPGSPAARALEDLAAHAT